ncbi:SseB family protein [Georgenia faecalis]|uniref:SseB family protein n=1 Tax=Georgenia faecalis TaxID=2483799 RepID=UPI000FD9C352|nr:SseB family protein [Georgenia faecalis]
MTPLPSGPAGDGAGTGDGADSAGRAWAGRVLRPNPFAGDDGSVDPAVAAALALGEDERADAVTAALASARVLVPIVAHAHPGRTGEGGVADHTAHGSDDPAGDACASAAMVSVRTPDGRAALPVFSSLETMAAWDATARPVPVEAARAALSAVSDADSLVVLDPAGPVTVLLGRPAVWALAQGRAWTPSWRDPELPAVAAAALRGIRELLGVRLERGRRAELRVVLAVDDRLDRERMADAVDRAGQALRDDPVLTDRVDSLELYPVPGHRGDAPA